MEQHKNTMRTNWMRLGAMIAVSTLIMFALMYQLVYSIDHVLFSMNRFVASLVMACVMTVIMISLMWSMYHGTKTKIAVLLAAALGFVLLVGANRSQVFIDDLSFMRAMIPHHSIAINNARKAHIADPRVRELADSIIESQVREVTIMKLLIEAIERDGKRGSVVLPALSADVTPEMLSEARAAVR